MHLLTSEARRHGYTEIRLGRELSASTKHTGGI